MTREQREVGRRQLAVSEQVLALQRSLVTLAEQLLAQVREINRKTPETPGRVVR
ncbi:MAG TPA: hypothetical protein VNA20_08340 [Frankiaceae bacterium]|nr:hypothetical protein [Frankiaceae bacterium]